MSIQIRWLGHSCFRIERGNYAIVLDPFEPGSVPGLAPIDEKADLVLCSHDHYDHNCRAAVKLPETPRENPFRVTALSSYHDDKQGELRGKNTIYLLEADGIKLVHFGDIGCMPSELILEKLRGADVILLPVGGHYTVGPAEAKAIADAVQPKAVIPMHYRSEAFGFDVLGPVEDFLALCGEHVQAPADTMEITAMPGGMRLSALGENGLHVDVTPKSPGSVVVLRYEAGKGGGQ